MQEVDVYLASESLPVFVSYIDFSLFEIEFLKKKILKYREKNPKSNTSNVKAWHSAYKTWIKDESFDFYIKVIKKEVERIINDFYKFENNKLNLSDMWINMYEKGDHTVLHAHRPSYFSCCFYIDVDKNCSSIRFPPELEIIPKNNMLVVFRGETLHEVNSTDGKRTNICMNFDRSKSPLSMDFDRFDKSKSPSKRKKKSHFYEL